MLHLNFMLSQRSAYVSGQVKENKKKHLGRVRKRSPFLTVPGSVATYVAKHSSNVWSKTSVFLPREIFIGFMLTRPRNFDVIRVMKCSNLTCLLFVGMSTFNPGGWVVLFLIYYKIKLTTIPPFMNISIEISQKSTISFIFPGCRPKYYAA